MAMNFGSSRSEKFDATPAFSLTGGGGGSAAAAAGNVNISDTYGALRDSSPRWDALASDAMKNRSNERQQAMAAEAQVTGQGLATFGQVQGQNIAGQYNLAAAKEAGQCTKECSRHAGHRWCCQCCPGTV